MVGPLTPGNPERPIAVILHVAAVWEEVGGAGEADENEELESEGAERDGTRK
jgi:hypothetical protein